MERDRELTQDAQWVGWKIRAKPGMLHNEEPDDDDDGDDGPEYSQLVSTQQGDDEIEKALSERWEMCERPLLASEDLERAEDGRTLR